MKTCTRCGSTSNKFNKNKYNKDGLQTHCSECQKAVRNAYYRAHKEQDLATSERSRKRRQAEAMAFIIEYKKKPCMDCGGTFNPWQMDLDHRDPSQKLVHVSKMLGGGYMLDLVKAEVEKCDLVCANCHRNRTFKKGQQSHGFRTMYNV